MRDLLASIVLSLALAATPALMRPAWGQSARKAAPGRYALNTIRKGTPYAVARSEMLAIGNVPDYHIDSEAQHCAPNPDMCRVYPETDTCSGTGLAYCRFGWTAKEGGHYFILTMGELGSRMPVSSIVRE